MYLYIYTVEIMAIHWLFRVVAVAVAVFHYAHYFLYSRKVNFSIFALFFLAGILVRAHRSKPPTRQRLRKESSVQQCERIPLMTSLRLEIPENPPISMLLIRIQLRLNIAPHIASHIIIPVRDVVLVGASAVVGGSREGPVEARTDAVPVEVLRAVGLGGGPFTDDHPFIGAAVGAGVVADALAMFPVLEADLVIGEDLVFVVVD
jgi:hypothetical protein